MPDSGPKLLLIDGNNMCHRVFWTHQELQHQGRHTGVLFGFFRQLIFLRKKFPDHFPIVAWDAGYDRRKKVSVQGVADGIIPSSYKEQREAARDAADDKRKEELEDLRTQMRQLRDEVLPLVRCRQARVKGEEADDIIYTYCQRAKEWGGSAVVVSSDRDFYQVLGIGDCVSIFDAMKEETWTRERFELEFGINPALWVDVGSFQGDSGDNIFGVDGWGPKTSLDYVRKYGNTDAVIAAVQALPKKSKKEQKLLESIPRIRMARYLKAMAMVPDVPMPACGPKEKEPLYQAFLDLGFVSLLQDIKLLI